MPDPDAAALVRLSDPPLGLPAMPLPNNTMPTPQQIALGRKLFFDRRLSHTGTLSCAMCHVPEQGFTVNETAVAVGNEGRSLRRNAPTLLNVGYQRTLFHDGREHTLELQVLSPLLSKEEMGNPSVGYLLDKIRNLPDYRGRFEEAFGKAVDIRSLGSALAAYQRTLVSANSAFDRWHYGEEKDALDAPARRGFALFTGKAGCSACHIVGDSHALFTDHAFHDTGVGWYASMVKNRASTPVRVQLAPGVFTQIERDVIESVGERPANDLGRYEVTLEPQDRWRYKTPTLRNIARTAPYMHDGSLQTLREVVEFYNRGGHPHPDIDPTIRPLELSETEIDALVAFLRSLTGDNLDELITEARHQPVGNPGSARTSPEDNE